MPLRQRAREVYDLRSIMSAEYSRGVLRILPSLSRAPAPALAQIAVPYMHRGFYDAKILTTLVVNSHNVLGSPRMKGDLSDREFTKAEGTFGARRVTRRRKF